jgi:hypothetical protein
MDIWDALWSRVSAPWPLSSTGLLPAILVYSLAVAIGWTLAWLLAHPVLQKQDQIYNELVDDYNGLIVERDDAIAALAAFLAEEAVGSAHGIGQSPE